jgi:hypothetical protein
MRQLNVLGLVAFVLASASAVQADNLPDGERKKIEQLIGFVAEMKDAVFVRNGAEYDAKTAAKFIRGKWQANAKDIKNARDFIEKAASVSSTSGKAYMIRFKDGKEVASRDYLSAELARIEKP